jgi:hypothetical protein
MPCDQVITNTVDMPKMQPDLLLRGLKDLGARNVRNIGSAIYFTTATGDYRLTSGVLVGLDGQDARTVGQQADALKVAYSTNVVKATAARAGWNLKQVGATAYVVQKR